MSESLTSNPSASKLEETTVMGRTVYVSPETKDAYVEFQDELVSMTNLRAWNRLMEQAKIQEIDGYDTEETLKDKELNKQAERTAKKLTETAYELQEEAQKMRNITN